MNGLLPLSLTLWLGQTPTPPATPDELPLVEPSLQQPQVSTVEELERTARELEVKRLRAQVELLQAELEVQRLENQNRLQSLEQQDAVEDARAQALEQLRLQRVASLRDGYQWMLTVDQLLEQGELSVGPALTYARQELSNALATAAETGRDNTVRLIESALDRLVIAGEAVEQRDVYRARLELQAAGFELRQAWRLSLQRQGTTLVNQ